MQLQLAALQNIVRPLTNNVLRLSRDIGEISAVYMFLDIFTQLEASVDQLHSAMDVMRGAIQGCIFPPHATAEHSSAT
jgi:hypothetical protein